MTAPSLAAVAGTARPLVGTAAVRPTLVLAALLILWACCNPFFATDRGSLIYAARALADLDPAGVGRDMMFRYDGQSAFTIFTGLFRALTEALGPSRATMLLSVASLVAGFVGAVVIATALFKGRTRYLAIAFAAVLPAYYGGYRLFSYAEVAATPRPFAEALVLCGLAALVKRKHRLAAILIFGAALLHPIMALPGVAVLTIWMALEDRRWIVAVLILAAVIALAAAAGMAPFTRLDTVIDPEWRAVLVQRNPHLFPNLWPSGWIGRMAARTATLLIAARLVEGPTRRLLLLVLAVGFAGFAVAYLLNERFAILLVVQAQTWRTMWVVFALAAAAAAICVVDLWPRGGTARLTLALLAVAWIYADNDLFAVIIGTIAVGLHVVLDPEDHAISPMLLRCALSILAVLGVIGLVHTQTAFHHVFGDAPVALKDNARRTIALSYDYMPLAVVAALAATLGRHRATMSAIGFMVAFGAVMLVTSWDQRSDADAFIDLGAGVPDLEARVAARQGEIYWIDGDRETWSWLHRPQWLSVVQGAGIVFSRDIAIRYSQRARRAIDLGLADDDILTPLEAPHASHIPSLAPGRVADFCAKVDAPAWIIAPLVGSTHLAAGIAASEWTAPVEKLVPLEQDDHIVWQRLSRYAIVPCAKP